MKNDRFEIVGIGTVAVDYVVSVERWPVCGEKLEYSQYDVCDGGNTATALVASARLGARTAFIGALNDSMASRRAMAGLQRANVDTTYVISDPCSEPVVAVVINSRREEQRTILYSLRSFRTPRLAELSDTAVISNAGCLLLDHNSGQGGYEAAELAKEQGVRILVDVEREAPYTSDFLDLADYIIVCSAFARSMTGAVSLEKMLLRMRRRTDQEVIITLGAQGCIGLTENRSFALAGHHVQVIDTTGCGDVFHGAFARALVEGKDTVAAARYANAAAALSATAPGGQAGIPDTETLVSFMQHYPGLPAPLTD